MRNSGWFILLLAAAAALGCGPSDPKLYPVSGTVTWNGQPLADGDILFVPVDGATVPDPGKIKDGKFSFQAQAGQKKVEIRATREAGPVDPVMGAPPRVQFVPAKYNDATELTAEVKPQEKNEFTFPLVEG